VRSLVILAMNYHAGPPLTADPLKGRISRYGWGDDYHGLIADRLSMLLKFIVMEAPWARGLFYADTGPVMEKVWGAHSSLGWMGKHTNLITRELGSWFFIGVILLDIDLDSDAVQKDHCGTCTRCIRACPTGAIFAPYKVDARRCISYLTIELRGPIPKELRPLIGNRIFGCDDCQDVCPWNRFAATSAEHAFWPREGNCMPELSALATITEQEFARRFQGSPIRRAKREGFVRNVVVALGNSHDPAALPALRTALGDSSSLVRSQAAWALGQIPSQEAVELLKRAQSTESDPSVLEEIECSLDRH
jgi:epoxyqueuosine reductase